MNQKSTNHKSLPKLTLKDVAAQLGVSTATVSNAFNRPSQLSTELRENILNECKKIGYAGPSASARNHRVAKTRVIGVMLSNQLSYSFSDPVANQMLQGLSQIFEEPEFNLLIMPSRKGMKNLSGIEAFVDGFIVYGPPDQERLEELRLHKKAIIAIDFDAPGVTSINIDNHKAAKDCALHAFKHFPKHPAILGLRLLDSEHVCVIEGQQVFDRFSNITVQRLNGYLDAAIQAEVYLPHKRIWHIPDNNQSFAYAAALQALNSPSRPELLLCMSDRIALSAVEAAKDLNLRVPQDVMITGFDGIDMAINATPSITTMQQPSMEKGRIAAEIFLGQREDQNITLHTPLRIGDSCPATCQ